MAPAFHNVYKKDRAGKFTHYWLKGGRGSAKSSFVSIGIILSMMRDPNVNAVVLRKVGQTLKTSVYAQLLWAIDMLGVGEYWDDKLSPLVLIYKPTGQRIEFRGGDKPRKIKSIKFKTGYCGRIWFEETDEFIGMEEIRLILQSLMRGGEDFRVYYTYNPPKSVRNWVNNEVLEPQPGKMVHHSTYLNVPRAWLGEQFLIEAEHLKKTNPEKYAHEYMGEVIGTGGEVFNNLTIREITDDEIKSFDKINRGLDWGYAGDPLHYTSNCYDSTRRRLYIFYEIHRVRMKTKTLSDAIFEENPLNEPIYADNNDARANRDMQDFGHNLTKVRKGKGSVDHGIKWLQDLEEIIIDPIRCPNTKREFYEYEIEQDKDGNLRGDFPDKNNHSIDATRYSLEHTILNHSAFTA